MTNKQLLFLLFIIISFVSCETNSTNKDDIPKDKLSKKEQLERLYTTIVKPIFSTYKDAQIPNNFVVDTTDISINAGSTHEYLEVSQGLINDNKEHIQIFVLSHEIAHIVTLNQAKEFKIGNIIPSGKTINDYKKSEYLADLIAIHLINAHLPKQLKLLVQNFDKIEQLLGSSDFMHPSGKERVRMMKKYITDSKKTSSEITFKKMFIYIWNLD